MSCAFIQTKVHVTYTSTLHMKVTDVQNESVPSVRYLKLISLRWNSPHVWLVCFCNMPETTKRISVHTWQKY